MLPIQQKSSLWGSTLYTITGNKSQTIGSSGCGLAACANVYKYLTGTTLDLRDLVRLSIDNGCRTPNDGTSERFVKIFADEYDLTFERTLDVNTAIEALNDGAGIVISTHGSAERIFTTEGHYLAIINYTDDGYFYIMDSDFYNGKYAAGNRPLEIKNKRLAVNVNTLEIWAKMELVTQEMSGFGFGIMRLKQVQKNSEDDEMIYNHIDDTLPTWARGTIQKLVDKGFLQGDENGNLGLNDTMLKIFAVNDRAGLYE